MLVNNHVLCSVTSKLYIIFFTILILKCYITDKLQQITKQYYITYHICMIYDYIITYNIIYNYFKCIIKNNNIEYYIYIYIYIIRIR